MKLILASTSPRRQDLLARLDIPFEIVAPEHVEEVHQHESFAETCRRLAREKAQAVARRHPCDLVIGADTIVILDQQLLGKPVDENDARHMLQLLSGKTHLVKTAVALSVEAKAYQSDILETTEVTFHPLNDAEIDRYVHQYRPLDKAGAYGIQDWSGVFVLGLKGCYHNVVGFPLASFYQHLKATGLYEELNRKSTCFNNKK